VYATGFWRLRFRRRLPPPDIREREHAFAGPRFTLDRCEGLQQILG